MIVATRYSIASDAGIVLHAMSDRAACHRSTGQIQPARRPCRATMQQLAYVRAEHGPVNTLLRITSNDCCFGWCGHRVSLPTIMHFNRRKLSVIVAEHGTAAQACSLTSMRMIAQVKAFCMRPASGSCAAGTVSLLLARPCTTESGCTRSCQSLLPAASCSPRCRLLCRDKNARVRLSRNHVQKFVGGAPVYRWAAAANKPSFAAVH
jgi:hypothetical protein